MILIVPGTIIGSGVNDMFEKRMAPVLSEKKNIYKIFTVFYMLFDMKIILHIHIVNKGNNLLIIFTLVSFSLFFFFEKKTHCL